MAPRRQLVIILSGELEIETSDGNKRHFRPGDMFLADDTTGSGHISRCLSDATALFVPVANIHGLVEARVIDLDGVYDPSC